MDLQDQLKNLFPDHQIAPEEKVEDVEKVEKKEKTEEVVEDTPEVKKPVEQKK